MPAIDDDDKPKKKIAHEIGQDLTLLSVEELAARAQLLRDEIQRIEADMPKQGVASSFRFGMAADADLLAPAWSTASRSRSMAERTSPPIPAATAGSAAWS